MCHEYDLNTGDLVDIPAGVGKPAHVNNRRVVVIHKNSCEWLTQDGSIIGDEDLAEVRILQSGIQELSVSEITVLAAQELLDYGACFNQGSPESITLMYGN